MASPDDSFLRALVVDDDETFVDHISYLMHKMGYAVERSFDGLDALKRCLEYLSSAPRPWQCLSHEC